MCDSCHATNPQCADINADLTYINFSVAAAWKHTIVTHEKYMEEDCVSPWAVLPGWRKESVWRDLAHIDFLGLGRDLGAGIIKSMFLRNGAETGCWANKCKIPVRFRFGALLNMMLALAPANFLNPK